MNNFSWQDPQLAQGKREATNPFWGRAELDEVIFTGVVEVDILEGRSRRKKKKKKKNIYSMEVLICIFNITSTEIVHVIIILVAELRKRVRRKTERRGERRAEK